MSGWSTGNQNQNSGFWTNTSNQWSTWGSGNGQTWGSGNGQTWGNNNNGQTQKWGGDAQQWGSGNNAYSQWGNFPSGDWGNKNTPQQGNSWQESQSASSAGGYSYFNKSGGDQSNQQSLWGYNQGNQQSSWGNNQNNQQPSWGNNNQNSQQSSWGNNQNSQQSPWDNNQNNQQSSWDNNQNNQQSSWGNNQKNQQPSWGNNQKNQQSSWGNNQNNQQSSWDYGQQAWQYQPQGDYGNNNQQPKWSTAAEDDDWGFNNSSSQQQAPWQNEDRGNDTKNTKDQSDSQPPAKKRARGDGSRKRRGGWENEDYDYNYNLPPNDDYYGGADWTEGGFDRRGDFYNDWSQIPQPGFRGNWDMGFQRGYYDDDAMYDYDYGGYQGGYDDPDDYYRGKQRLRNRERRQRDHEPRESPDDRLLYKKHRTLTQDKKGRKALNGLVKCVSHAMLDASRAMSTELMESLKPKTDATMEVTSEDATDEKEASEEKVAVIAKDATDEKDTTDENATAEKDATDESVATAEKDVAEAPKKDGQDKGGKEESNEKKELPPKILIGMIRVGPAQRKLITGDESDLGAEFVAVFEKKPTKTYFFKLASLIHQKLKKSLAEKIIIEPDEASNTIIIKPGKDECPYPIVISFTSPVYSPEYQATESEKGEDETATDLLNEEKCIEALAKIRRVRWSLRKIRAEIELPTVRILLDLRDRYSGWKHLSPYAAEVLVHFVMEKLAKDVRESELSFSRLFIQCLEVLAEGMALSGGPGLKDPCETQPVDVFSYLEPQHAEDLTRAAQNALRLASFGKLKELLKMDS